MYDDQFFVSIINYLTSSVYYLNYIIETSICGSARRQNLQGWIFLSFVMVQA